MKVDNFILEKCLAKGANDEVYLTKKIGENKYYATKRYKRDKIEKSETLKYLNNEIRIMQTLNHPNIVKLEDIKKTKNHFYIIMEYCNGGELSKALKEYKIKYGKPFSEELVQYLMRQIINAFKYIHNKRIVHGDFKLKNILLHYNNERDKKEVNLMKAKIKIKDFGFASKIDTMTYTSVGSSINIDSFILNKLNLKGKKGKQLVYTQKVDIWSLGTICYEMLIGKAAFDTDDIDDLVNKFETGKYKVPTTLSKEVISFLIGMLQYNPKNRLNINQLAAHQFLIKNVKEFHSINLIQVSNILDNTKRNIVIDIKRNSSIWVIFNKEDEDKLINISPGYLAPIDEDEENLQQHRNYSQEIKPKIQIKEVDNPIRKSNTFKMKGINMDNINNKNIINQSCNDYNYHNYNNSQNEYYGFILHNLINGNSGNPIYQNNIISKMKMH